MLDTLGSEDADDETPIPITKVTGDVLKKVVEWGDHHKNEAHLEDDEEEGEEKKYDPYEFDKDYKIVIDDWDAKFFEVSILKMFVQIFSYKVF